MDAVLGPDRRGVIRLADVPPDDLEAPLLRAGISSATPLELGLGLPGPSSRGPMAPGPGNLEGLAGYVAVALRRPAVVRLDGGWAVAGADGHIGRGSDVAELCVGMEGPPPRRVAVFGGAWIAEDDPDYGDIRSLGRWLGERRAHLVCGGYQGAMAASCRGVAEAGGTAVGVTISAWDDVVEPNRWLTHKVIARDLFSRLPVITDADAWVAFGGGVGTLQEVALCWHLVQNALASPRPLLLVGEGWDRQLRLFRELLRVSDTAHFDLVRPVASVEDVLPVLDPLIVPA